MALEYEQRSSFMKSRYLHRPTEKNFTTFDIEDETLEGIVEIGNIYCDDNIQVTQFSSVDDAQAVVERGKRSPYTFTLDITFIEVGGVTVSEQVKQIINYRQLKKPLSITWDRFKKYGIEKMTILDFSVEEYFEYAKVMLNCEEFMEFDIDEKQLTPEQESANQSEPSYELKSAVQALLNIWGS